MFGFNYGGGGLQQHEQRDGCSSGHGAGISPETERNDAVLFFQPRSHAFPNLLGDGFFRIL